MVLILVLVMLRLLGPTLVRALHVMHLLRAELSRPRHRLLKACADVEPVAIGRPSTHRLDVDWVRAGGEEGRRAADAERVRAEERRVLADGAAYLTHDVPNVVRSEGRAVGLAEHRRVTRVRAIAPPATLTLTTNPQCTR